MSYPTPRLNTRSACLGIGIVEFRNSNVASLLEKVALLVRSKPLNGAGNSLNFLVQVNSNPVMFAVSPLIGAISSASSTPMLPTN